MRSEQLKTEWEQKQEAKEMPPVQESPEKIGQEMFEQSEKEVSGFKSDGQMGLETLEKRASSEELTIDEIDKNELAKLDREADTARTELVERINPAELAKETVEENQTDKKELGEFSKKYSSFKRSEIASQVWKMRKERRQQKKQAEEQNLEVRQQRAEITKEVESTKGKIESIEKSIADLEKSVQEQKSKIWYKFTHLFKKEKLDDEKSLEEAQQKLGQAKEELAEKSRLIEETREVILESSELDEAKEELEKFYSEQSEVKSKFEEEREQRDLTRISREKGVLFFHGMPLSSFDTNSTEGHNLTLNTREIDVQSRIQMVVGLEPTLSMSTINENKPNKGMYYPFGIIIKSGEVLSAYKGDASSDALGLYARRGYSSEQGPQKSIIQEDIANQINEAVENKHHYDKYNEIIVQNPKISGLCINIENPNRGVDLSQIKRISDQLGLPVIGLMNGKMFDLTNDGKEVSLDEVLEKEDLSFQERLSMAEDSIESLFPALKNEKARKEAKRKLEELRGAADLLSEKKTDLESHGLNFLNAKEISFKGGMANWAKKILSEGDNINGDDIVVRAVNGGLNKNEWADLESIFEGKTREECLGIIDEFKRNKDKVDYFFGKGDRNIQF